LCCLQVLRDLADGHDQVFVSFADKRNLQNAMDASSNTSVSMKALTHTEALQDAAPLLSSTEFDFHSHNYSPPSLLQQVFIYLRLKASAFRCLSLLFVVLV